MNSESKKFLRDFLSQCGPSGFEEASQNVWVKRTKEYAQSIKRDVHGNAIAVLNPKAEYKIMIAGHCDEIGFIISHITTEGFLCVVPVGGIDSGVLPGSQVKVQTEKGLVDGVIGKKPIHLMEECDRNKSVLKVVALGDAVSFAPNYMDLRNNIFSSKGCDDKTGAFVVSEVIKILSTKKLRKDVGVFGVSTVQEEVGLRGAKTSAYGINPQVGIAVDVGFASDTPGIDKRIVGEVALGKGPVLHAGPAINRALGKMFIDVAKRKKIHYQFSSLGRPDGTDTGAIQLSREGVATALISVPNRYMHTMVETCSLDDLESCAQLIAETILEITPKMDFIPR